MSFFLITLVAIALAGLPLFLVLSILALAGYITTDQVQILYFAQLIQLAEKPTLLAIPLFTLAGFILAESRASDRLIKVARLILGWMPGGLAIVALVTMAIFTAFTGASGVTIVAMGGLLMPSLIKSGYKEKFSLGLLTASGSIGLLFPPSIPLIIYGVVSETPIDSLFIGGILPGIVIITGMAIYCFRHGLLIKHEIEEKQESIIYAIKDAIWELLLPVVVIGGIYGGLFTVTEAAVVTVHYLIVVECFIKRDIKIIRDMPRILTESSVLVGGILVILGAALALTNVLVYLDIPTVILNWIKEIVKSPIAFLLLLNIFLLLVGFLMDIFSALVVIVPLIYPIAMGYGIDPVHLGIIFLANLEIGYCTPPVGLNLFIASFRFNRPVLSLYKAALPFLGIQLIALLLITYIPALTLFPVSIIKGSSAPVIDVKWSQDAGYPEYINFNDVYADPSVGVAYRIPVNINNNGDKGLVIKEILSNNKNFRTDWDLKRYVISPGDSIMVNIFFEAHETGEYNGTFTIISNSKDESEIGIKVHCITGTSYHKRR